MARGAYAEALLCYESMVELDPRNSKALNGLGAALCKLGRYREAEQFFRRALRLKPNAADVLANLGALLRWRGRAPPRSICCAVHSSSSPGTRRRAAASA